MRDQWYWLIEARHKLHDASKLLDKAYWQLTRPTNEDDDLDAEEKITEACRLAVDAVGLFIENMFPSGQGEGEGENND
ncbi:MAG: hypothetical protein KatS3mg018_0585 [Fimbriimonadales bacterium]|nr:MAG: hypothetical protein KatS3mg018_0585 [Fimbriimonadales bacterium]